MLHKALKKLDKTPFHMPGHKRNEKFGIIGSEIDITEIDGFDNLHNPSGMIADIESSLAEIYGTEKSFLLVNGSTVGILAAIHAVCNRGETVIVARNCHKSVFNACLLLELKVCYIEPEFDCEHGIYTRLSQRTVDSAVKQNPDASAIIITSPTYEGYISNIKSELPLIIDSAHGAHLGIGGFPEYPKGDIVISSLHKTLPALTQTAVANVYHKDYIKKVKRYTDIFETSSPSYVLMNSASICCEYIKNNEQDFAGFRKAAVQLRSIELKRLKIINTDDYSKIVVSTAKADMNGTELANILRRKYSIEPESTSLNSVILMTSVGDTKEALSTLNDALIEIDRECSLASADAKIEKPPCPAEKQLIKYSGKQTKTKISRCEGRIANEFIYAYPPDIPILVPNEVITRQALEYIEKALENNIALISDSDLLPNYILTK